MSYHKDIFMADRMSLENMDHAEQKRHNNATALYMRGFDNHDSIKPPASVEREFKNAKTYEEANRLRRKYSLKYGGLNSYLLEYYTTAQRRLSPKQRRA